MSENGERRLYATWRNPDGLIRPVGVLTRQTGLGGESYRFVYLKAAEGFDDFHGIPGLDDLHGVYESDRLFAVFRNRQMPRRRPDYPDYVQRLGLDVDTDPFEVLIRSEGWRATDRLEVFGHPQRTPEGELSARFFARGIRHSGARGVELAATIAAIACRPGRQRTQISCRRLQLRRRVDAAPSSFATVLHAVHRRITQIR